MISEFSAGCHRLVALPFKRLYTRSSVFAAERCSNKSFGTNLVSLRFLASYKDRLYSVSLYSRDLFQAYYGMENAVLFSGMEGLEHIGMEVPNPTKAEL